MTGTRCQPGSPRAGASPSRSRDLAAAHEHGPHPVRRPPSHAPPSTPRVARSLRPSAAKASRSHCRASSVAGWASPVTRGRTVHTLCAPLPGSMRRRARDVPRGCRPSSRGRDECPAVSVSAPRRPGCTTCGTSPPVPGAVHKDDARHPTPLCPEARILIGPSRVDSLFRRRSRALNHPRCPVRRPRRHPRSRTDPSASRPEGPPGCSPTSARAGRPHPPATTGPDRASSTERRARPATR